MWIITASGFLSVVQNIRSKGPDEALLVRGRVREDLDDFADFAARHGGRPAVASTPHADYGYRLTTSRERLASYLAEQVGALDYPNFKDKVAAGHPRRARIYMNVWAALGELRSIGDGGKCSK